MRNLALLGAVSILDPSAGERSSRRWAHAFLSVLVQTGSRIPLRGQLNGSVTTSEARRGSLLLHSSHTMRLAPYTNLLSSACEVS